MCIGIPVQVIESDEFTARCRGRNGEVTVNLMLVGGPQPPGTWLTNFLGSARDILSEEDARNADMALDALSAVMSGEEDVDFDQYFPGLESKS